MDHSRPRPADAVVPMIPSSSSSSSFFLLRRRYLSSSFGGGIWGKTVEGGGMDGGADTAAVPAPAGVGVRLLSQHPLASAQPLGIDSMELFRDPGPGWVTSEPSLGGCATCFGTSVEWDHPRPPTLVLKQYEKPDRFPLSSKSEGFGKAVTTDERLSSTGASCPKELTAGFSLRCKFTKF